MQLVYVCLNNFQEYILPNIRQSILLKIGSIHVICNRTFFPKFAEFTPFVHLVAVEDLKDRYFYNQRSQMDNDFRGGFWTLTSTRFFVINEAMEKYCWTDVIHIENDVLLYYPIDHLSWCIPSQKIRLPFDCFSRNIASIMYIPNHRILNEILKDYDMNLTDMQNFVKALEKTERVAQFPILPMHLANGAEEEFVANGWTEQGESKFVFDAAAIGQYVGGVDPANMGGDTRGFVNETCVVKYNKWNIEWIDKKPFLCTSEGEYPIFNLHIHCKDLERYRIQ